MANHADPPNFYEPYDPVSRSAMTKEYKDGKLVSGVGDYIRDLVNLSDEQLKTIIGVSKDILKTRVEKL